MFFFESCGGKFTKNMVNNYFFECKEEINIKYWKSGEVKWHH